MSPFWILLIAVGAVLLLILGLGCAMAVYSMRIKRQTLDEARAWQEAHYDLSWYDPLEKDNYLVKGLDGYALHVQYLHNPRPCGRCVIISHGYTDNRFGALKYAKLYLDLGFDVVVYDLRGHGENEKTYCTYSVRESRDLTAVIRDTRKRHPELELLGLHGESLGAATTIACLKYRPAVDFAVADCGFSEITSVMAGALRKMHLPGALVRLTSVCAKLIYGCSFSKMRPIDSLKGTTLPILFLHGEKDDFVLPAHSVAMHHAAESHSSLHFIPNAPHAISVLTAPADYRRYVTDFLRSLPEK